MNREVDPETAEEMSKLYLEAIIAPGYQEDALAILKKKVNLRLLKTGEIAGQTSDRLDIRKINGGLLVQEADRIVLNPAEIKVVTKRQPTKEEMEELFLP